MTKKDFSSGSIWKHIINQSVPLMCAQLVLLLYNVIDRVYIGHLAETGSLALTGIGLVFPITTLISAFTLLFGSGGAPLFSIARGAKEEETAEKIISQVLMLLCIFSVILFVFCYVYRKPILYLFGASDASFVYADEYLKIYLFGIWFSMFATGMNSYINAQGFPKVGMGTIIIGAICNLILDPIFIFALNMGVSGAAIATVISQGVSAVWVLKFFAGKQTGYHFKREYMVPDFHLIKQIVSLGMAGFIMAGTNCLVQIVCNKTLRMYGGDLYVGIMTVINSVREVLSLPASSLGSGAQPVIGYNYGAKQYSKVRQGIRFTAIVGVFYLAAIWVFVLIFATQIFTLFTNDAGMVTQGVEAMKLYLFGFFFMAFQFAGQTAFTSLGCAKRAIFFSIFRKVIIVVPLTIILPTMGFGVNGVFLAEPISNAIGGLANFTTMYLTLYRKLPKEDEV